MGSINGVSHTMKYVKVRFPGGVREFTYSCKDDTVQPTDEVQITTPTGALMTLSVTEVSDNQPPFACKPALKLASAPSGNTSTDDEIPF